MKYIFIIVCVIILTTILNFGWFRYYLWINPYQTYNQYASGTEIKINQVYYSLNQFQQSLIESVEKSKESVVSIVVTKDFAYYYNSNPFSLFEDFFSTDTVSWWQFMTGSREVGGWSGIYISKDWYILTNKHVVNDPQAKYTVIFSNGKTAEAEQVWLDPQIDIAVIKITNPIGFKAEPAIVLSLFDEVHVWQFAVAIGNTLAQYRNSVTFGIISWRNRQLDVKDWNIYVGLYQTDTAISQGNSWGPLFDINGRVLGINTAVSAVWSNIGFAIPVTQEFINATIKSIQNYWKIVRPFLGIQYIDINPSVAQKLNISFEKGVYIQEVLENSLASKVWIQKGDIIISLNNKQIDDEYPFLYQLYTHEVWDILSLSVVRDWQEKKLDIRIE